MDSNLIQSFKSSLRYKSSSQLAKPFTSPRRFLNNQLRQRVRPRAGTLQIVHAFHMDRFHIVAGELVSEGIACYGIMESNLTGAFLNLIKPGQTALDVGMHLGYFSTLMARLVGPSGTVHSFEPTPSTRDFAAKNTEQFPNITVHPNAMWSHHEKMNFHDYGVVHMAFNSMSTARMEEQIESAREFEVEAISLDEFRDNTGEKIDVIKIDAENAELEIITGGQQTLLKDRPIVSLEVGDEATQAGRSRLLVETMVGLEFVPWEFNNGKFHKHAVRDKYVYDNLIFAPVERPLNL